MYVIYKKINNETIVIHTFQKENIAKAYLRNLALLNTEETFYFGIFKKGSIEEIKKVRS